jgi:sulfotransferase
MKLHVLAGLPRSGTTLLGNVLAQHPDVYVSGTSALPNCIESIVNTLSNVPEIISDLANVKGSYERYVVAMRMFCEGWYTNREEEHILDKGRGWIMYRDLLEQLSPGSTMVVCVRDPRNVIASIERQDRKTAVFNNPIARTLYERADILMKKDAMVGGPIRMIEDLIRRQSSNVVFVRYESLVADPAVQVEKVATAMGLAPFQHDLQGVENIATDLDALYRFKYPHDGSGAIKPTGHNWSEVMDEPLAQLIASVYPLYMQNFGYA